MYGLVLEGGGAKGAYHVGAIQAFMENGYEIGAVVGTSIGAINGAMVASKEFDKLYEAWKELSFSSLMEIDEIKLERLFNKNIDLRLLKYLSKKLKGTISNGGIDTKKMKNFISTYVDEQKVRDSDIDFGLVTVCLTDRKPLELYINEIPNGMLIDYLIASARLPIFKAEPLESKLYIDGGIYNNCPLNMIIKKDYKKAIVIRVTTKGKIKGTSKFNKDDLLVVEPKEELLNMVNFGNKVINSTIELGYLDALKVIKKLDGYNSYINPIDENKIIEAILKYDEDKILEIGKNLNLESKLSPKKLMFEKIIPVINKKVNPRTATKYKVFLCLVLEYIAKKENINLLKVYDIKELLNLVKSKIRTADKIGSEKAIYTFVKYFEI